MHSGADAAVAAGPAVADRGRGGGGPVRLAPDGRPRPGFAPALCSPATGDWVLVEGR